MNSTAAHSIPGLANRPIEASEVEKPPVATVVMACTDASNRVIPRDQ